MCINFVNKYSLHDCFLKLVRYTLQKLLARYNYFSTYILKKVVRYLNFWTDSLWFYICNNIWIIKCCLQTSFGRRCWIFLKLYVVELLRLSYRRIREIPFQKVVNFCCPLGRVPAVGGATMAKAEPPMQHFF